MVDKSKALTWTELRVGLVVIASLVTLAFTIFYIGGGGGTPFSPRYVVKAVMMDVNGLKPGAPVRVGGVEVGNVTEVDFAPRGGVEVTMRLDRRVQPRITTDSQATLGALGLLGEKAVDITSSVRGRMVEDGGYLPAAAEDPFKGLLSDASDSTAHMRRILARMDAGEGLIGKALRDEELYTRMADVSQRLQLVMSKLETVNGPLGRLVNDTELSGEMRKSAKGISDAISRLDSGEGALGALSKDPELERSLKETAKNLDQVAGRLDKGEGTLGKLLRDEALGQRIESAVTHLDQTLTKLQGGEGTAGKLLQDPEMYNNLNGALKDLRTLLANIERQPQRYLRVKLSLF